MDLSRCNDLEYIGDYAFQCDTVNQFKLPKNNHALTSLGGHAFSGVRFYNDLDFRGFKNLTTIGE
ncbi:hypothetical protein FACS1894166_05900 [Bacilli bacterium]|nr:hypothetical protein FACS1894166_05900 [Bacilli bacterium]